MTSVEISIPEHVLYQRTGDAMVLLDSMNGQYFELNETAASAFEALLETQDPAAACVAVTKKFEVTQIQARQDIEILMKKLAAAGLLQIADCST
ncbi:MAG: lasso peptide biosynthesis PqqD family chaperone [Lysobacterales bacterium]